MFPQILRGFQQVFNNGKQMSVHLYSTGITAHITQNVIHSIRVTGKVENIFTHDNSTVVFYIKSLVPTYHKYKMHKICATERNPILLDIASTKLALGQKVRVEGNLRSEYFTSDDGRRKTKTTIMATELCIFSDVGVANDSENSQSIQDEAVDENKVELSGVVTNVVTGDEFKAFYLATPKSSNLSYANAENLNFNQIFVYDEALFPKLDELETKESKVFVRGNINYSFGKDDTGRMATASFIVAEQIYRM